VESLATNAFRFTVVPTWTLAGAAGRKFADSVVAGTIAIAFDCALSVLSAAEVAVIVTLVPTVVTGGAV
jgi:hypothetical protein